jgi:DNA-binding XRE family transcriptional regulator
MGRSRRGGMPGGEVIAFGDRVREARQRIRAAGGGRLTQGDLAIAVGVERNTVSRWENSGVRPKDPQVVRKLAEVLHVSMEWLFAEDDGGSLWPAVPADHAPGPVHDRAVRVPYAPHEVLAQRMPPPAYEKVHAYVERAERAGATPGQSEEVARILLDAVATPLRTVGARDRPIDDVLADIDAAWRYVATVLRGEGRQV